MSNEMKRTHKGLMFGLVPVFLDMSDEECPAVEGRNFVCDIILDIVTPIFGVCIFIMTMVNREYEPAFPIKITGEIVK